MNDDSSNYLASNLLAHFFMLISFLLILVLCSSIYRHYGVTKASEDKWLDYKEGELLSAQCETFKRSKGGYYSIFTFEFVSGETLSLFYSTSVCEEHEQALKNAHYFAGYHHRDVPYEVYLNKNYLLVDFQKAREIGSNFNGIIIFFIIMFFCVGFFMPNRYNNYRNKLENKSAEEDKS